MGGRYVFDIETNGLLDQLDTVHSLVMYNLDTESFYTCTDHEYSDYHEVDGKPCYGLMSIKNGLEILMEADEVVGHNIIDFDIPAIQKVYPWFRLSDECHVRDTLLLSQLMWPNIRELDFKRWNKETLKREKQGKGAPGLFPGQFIGRHSLEAWGHRLREWKGDYSAEMKAKGLDPWAAWNAEMQDYCEQDVVVTTKLYAAIGDKGWSAQSLYIEQEFARIIRMQERRGFAFNEEEALALYTTLSRERQEVERQLAEVFPPFWMRDGQKVTPTKTLNYKDPLRADRTEGASFTPVKLVEFNPASRPHIANRLMYRLGWKPTVFTDQGQPKVDESTLNGLPWPEAELLNKYLMLNKRLGALYEGDQAWLKVVKMGRIHGRVNTAGAVTRRCTHSKPNVAQVPSVENSKGPVPYGHECRSLFIPSAGYVLVGVDASGLELRCLAHYMGRYDGGAYAELLLNGDIHTANQLAAGLPTRSNAKTFIYAFLYGAGDEKIGSIVGKGRGAGAKLKKAFLAKTPALKKLMADIDLRVKKTRGTLKAIDGGVLHVRHSHAALNTLLQSAGAIVMKLALVLLDQSCRAQGWTHGNEYAFVANIHDEIQSEVRPECVEKFKELAVESIREAGKSLGFRCPLDGEAKAGTSWADTH